MSTARLMEREIVERKVISVSSKRQITIPLKFFEKLNLDSEVECYIDKGALVVRPLSRDQGEFSVEILKDLVAQGYSGDELISQFEIYSRNMKQAIGAMLEEADEIASGQRKGATIKDVFGPR